MRASVSVSKLPRGKIISPASGLPFLDRTPLSDKQKEDAWLCYFYGQVVGFIDSVFTPVPQYYEHWIRRPFHRLVRERSVKLTVDALTTATPACLLQSEEYFCLPADAPQEKKFSLAFWR